MSYNAKRLQLLEKCKKKKIREQAHLSMRWLRQVGKRAVFPSILLRPKVSECVQHKFLGSVWGGNHVDTISRALVLRQVTHPGSLLEDHRCASAVRIGEIICVIFHQESSSKAIQTWRNHQLLAFWKYSVKMANCKLSFSGFVPPAAYFVQ